MWFLHRVLMPLIMPLSRYPCLCLFLSCYRPIFPHTPRLFLFFFLSLSLSRRCFPSLCTFPVSYALAFIISHAWMFPTSVCRLFPPLTRVLSTSHACTSTPCMCLPVSHGLPHSCTFLLHVLLSFSCFCPFESMLSPSHVSPCIFSSCTSSLTLFPHDPYHAFSLLYTFSLSLLCFLPLMHVFSLPCVCFLLLLHALASSLPCFSPSHTCFHILSCTSPHILFHLLTYSYLLSHASLPFSHLLPYPLCFSPGWHLSMSSVCSFPTLCVPLLQAFPLFFHTLSCMHVCTLFLVYALSPSHMYAFPSHACSHFSVLWLSLAFFLSCALWLSSVSLSFAFFCFLLFLFLSFSSVDFLLLCIRSHVSHFSSLSHAHSDS